MDRDHGPDPGNNISGKWFLAEEGEEGSRTGTPPERSCIDALELKANRAGIWRMPALQTAGCSHEERIQEGWRDTSSQRPVARQYAVYAGACMAQRCWKVDDSIDLIVPQLQSNLKKSSGTFQSGFSGTGINRQHQVR